MWKGNSLDLLHFHENPLLLLILSRGREFSSQSIDYILTVKSISTTQSLQLCRLIRTRRTDTMTPSQLFNIPLFLYIFITKHQIEWVQRLIWLHKFIKQIIFFCNEKTDHSVNLATKHSLSGWLLKTRKHSNGMKLCFCLRKVCFFSQFSNENHVFLCNVSLLLKSYMANLWYLTRSAKSKSAECKQISQV